MLNFSIKLKTAFNTIFIATVILLFSSFNALANINVLHKTEKYSILSSHSQHQKLSGLSLPFIQNQGELNKEVAYYARTFAGTTFVTQDGVLVMSLLGKPLLKETGEKTGILKHSSIKRGSGWVLSETPVSQIELHPQGLHESPTKVSIFRGNDPTPSKRDIKTFDTVSFGQPWAGIDYQVHAHGNNIERIFTVSPGFYADAIQMQVNGANKLSLDAGHLIAHTGSGPVTLTKPIAYQIIDGQQKPVEVSYTLKGNQYGFMLGHYEPNYPLVIDPLLKATYLGGARDDAIKAMAISQDGFVYVAGNTDSADFPGTVGGGIENAEGDDGFISKLTANLDQVIQTSYFSISSSTDEISSIAIGPDANVYAAGVISKNPFAKNWTTAVVFKLTSDLTEILDGAVLKGEEGISEALSIAVGASNQVYVAGYTNSEAFPDTEGSLQPVYGGGDLDAFIAKFDGNDFENTIQTTFLGGRGRDIATSLTINALGDIYVSGVTTDDFPGTSGGAQENVGSDSVEEPDVFVAKLSSDLKTISQSTYLGGENSEGASYLAPASDGRIYVAGNTDSRNFPGTSRGAQSTFGGKKDAFITLLSGDLKSLSNSSYLGGGDEAVTYAVALGSNGHVYVAGKTGTLEGNTFPGTVIDGSKNYRNDEPFIAEFSGDLGTIFHSLQFGSRDSDGAYSLATTSDGKIYVAGSAGSRSEIYGIDEGAQNYRSGRSDGFVMLFDNLQTDKTPPTVSANNITTDFDTIATATASITGSGTLNLTATSSDTDLLPNNNITGQSQCTSEGNCKLTLTPSFGQSGETTITLRVTDSVGQSTTDQFKLKVNAVLGENDERNEDSSGGGVIGLWFLLLMAMLIAINPHLRAIGVLYSRKT